MSEIKSLALAPTLTAEIAVRDPVAEVGSMLSMAVAKGITPENAAALEKLTELYERAQDRAAKEKFATALKAFQSEATKVAAMKMVPNKDGTPRYQFAEFSDIMDAVQPLADRHGFVITFGELPPPEGKITKTCELMHVSGHTKTNSYTCRVGQGPPGASASQADAATHSYAKRGALCDALNIVINKDVDANMIGKPITKEQAADLRRRVRETGSDEALFLKFAQADTYEEIHDSMLDTLLENLRRKEKTT